MAGLLERLVDWMEAPFLSEPRQQGVNWLSVVSYTPLRRTEDGARGTVDGLPMQVTDDGTIVIHGLDPSLSLRTRATWPDAAGVGVPRFDDVFAVLGPRERVLSAMEASARSLLLRHGLALNVWVSKGTLVANPPSVNWQTVRQAAHIASLFKARNDPWGRLVKRVVDSTDTGHVSVVLDVLQDADDTVAEDLLERARWAKEPHVQLWAAKRWSDELLMHQIARSSFAPADIRVQALDWLVWARDDDLVTTVRSLFASGDPKVRRHALHVASAQRLTTCIPEILAMQGDSDTLVLALHVLGVIGTAAIEDELWRIERLELLPHVIRTLGTLGSPRSIPYLRTYLMNPLLRSGAQHAIASIEHRHQVSAGALSLADVGGGELSVADATGGELSKAD